jgi:hypothetical protein
MSRSLLVFSHIHTVVLLFCANSVAAACTASASASGPSALIRIRYAPSANAVVQHLLNRGTDCVKTIQRQDDSATLGATAACTDEQTSSTVQTVGQLTMSRVVDVPLSHVTVLRKVEPVAGPRLRPAGSLTSCVPIKVKS